MQKIWALWQSWLSGWQDHDSEEVWVITEVNDWIEEELERRYRWCDENQWASHRTGNCGKSFGSSVFWCIWGAQIIEHVKLPLGPPFCPQKLDGVLHSRVRGCTRLLEFGLQGWETFWNGYQTLLYTISATEALRSPRKVGGRLGHCMFNNS